MNNNDYHRLMLEFSSNASIYPDFQRFFKNGYPEVHARFYRDGFREFITPHDASVILREWQKDHGFEFYHVKRIIARKSLDLL